MPSIYDTTAHANMLKVLYPDGPELSWFEEAPFLAMVKKTYDFEGESKQTNNIYAGTPGGSTFAAAMRAKKNTPHVKFNVTRKKEYQIFEIDEEALMVSESKRGAVAKPLKVQTDSAYYGYGQQLSFSAWRDGTGTRGTVSAYNAGVITLTEPTDARFFEDGMELEKKSAAGALYLGSMEVTAVNRQAGTVTVTLLDGAADPIATDTLARWGDYTASGSNVISGILSWIPLTAPTSTPFFGVDRTQDIERLSGVRFTGSSSNIAETVFHAMAQHAGISGGKHDHLYLNPFTWAELQTQAFAKGWVNIGSTTVGQSTTSRGGSVTIGFEGFSFPSPSGRGKVIAIADAYCPINKGLLTRLASWELSSAGDNPHWADRDGKRLRVSAQSDSMEGRLKGYLNLLNHKPLDSCIISFA